MISHFFKSENKPRPQAKDHNTISDKKIFKTEQDEEEKQKNKPPKFFQKIVQLKQKFRNIQKNLLNSYSSESMTPHQKQGLKDDQDQIVEVLEKKNNKMEDLRNQLRSIGNQGTHFNNFKSNFHTPLVSDPIWNEYRTRMFKAAISPDFKSKNYYSDNFLKTSNMEDYKIQTNRSQEVVFQQNPIEQLKADFLIHSTSIENLIYESERKAQKSAQKKSIIEQSTVADLTFLAKLGSGQYGRVYLVKLKGIDQPLALKYVTRRNIQQSGIYKQMQQELHVLQQANNPLIMKFYRSYKDDENIYFLTEYIAGFELFDAIRIIGLLNKQSCQFYIAQMILQIEYLHNELNVVYRDLKPENLMVDNEGYLRLIDMGSAKALKTKYGTMNKTFTIIGTPHYMAPEIIQGQGYNYLADLWSLGVCFYEFVCGGLPFGEEKEDPFEIYNEIIRNSLVYNSHISDKSAAPFIGLLLHKTPQFRMNGGYESLKSNEWFNDFNWDHLIQRKLKPPTLPPSDRLYNHQKLQQLEKKQISVIQQILQDTKGEKKFPYTSNDWDSVF